MSFRSVGVISWVPTKSLFFEVGVMLPGRWLPSIHMQKKKIQLLSTNSIDNYESQETKTEALKFSVLIGKTF